MTNEQIINSISKDVVIPNGVNESLSFSDEDNMNEDVNKSRNEMIDLIDFAYGKDWISDEVLMANGASEDDDGEDGYFTGMSNSQMRELYELAVEAIKNNAESNPVTWKSWGGLNRLNELGFDWNIAGTKLIQE